jgi:hypothetical protein
MTEKQNNLLASKATERLLDAGVPQSAIDRMLPELSGDLVWNPNTFCFEESEERV